MCFLSTTVLVVLLLFFKKINARMNKYLYNCRLFSLVRGHTVTSWTYCDVTDSPFGRLVTSALVERHVNDPLNVHQVSLYCGVLCRVLSAHNTSQDVCALDFTSSRWHRAPLIAERVTSRSLRSNSVRSKRAPIWRIVAKRDSTGKKLEFTRRNDGEWHSRRSTYIRGTVRITWSTGWGGGFKPVLWTRSVSFTGCIYPTSHSPMHPPAHPLAITYLLAARYNTTGVW